MKGFKRLMAVICALVLIISTLFTVSAAKKTWSPIINIDSVTAARGDTVFVNVVLVESQEGIMAATFSVLYDNSALSYQGYKRGLFYSGYEVADHNDYIAVVVCDTGTNFNTGNIITLEFKVRDTAFAGKYPLKLAKIRPRENGESLRGCFANWRGDTINPIVTNGSLTIPTTQENCRHNYGDWEIKLEPTCTQKGLKTKVCKNCGKNENEEIALKDHEFESVWTVDRQATATEDGVMSRHCKGCEAKTDYKTFKLQIPEDNNFKNEVDTKVDEDDWGELSGKTDESNKIPEIVGKDPNTNATEPIIPDKDTDKSDETPFVPNTENIGSADELIEQIKNQTDKRLGIAGRVYNLISVIIKAFSEYIENIF